MFKDLLSSFMAIMPNTSRAPLPPPLAMSAAQDLQDAPSSSSTTSSGTVQFTPTTPSPLPPRPGPSDAAAAHAEYLHHSLATWRHNPKPKWNKPRIILKVQDALHPAAQLFFRAFIASELLEEVVDAVLTQLYGSASGDQSTPARPSVRSITLVLRSMDGVAYTTGNDSLGDSDHKEIHFSLEHIKNTIDGARRQAKQDRINKLNAQAQATQTSMSVDAIFRDGGSGDDDPDKAADKRGANEIHGVLVHEMVHVWQWNGLGSAPGGLIEGIADYVRLKEGLEPPHWNKAHKGDKWDAGYQQTAYFLAWCEKEVGEGKVQAANAWLRENRYKGDEMWQAVFGRDVDQLWKEYTASS